VSRYVAFLRAINVGGHVVKMDHLRDLFAGMGLTDVTTQLASGNVLFTSGRATPASLERKIEKGLEKALGYEVPTFLRTSAEVASVAAHEAFPAAETGSAHALYAGFLKEPLTAEQTRVVLGFRSPNDDFAVNGREILWLCRERSMESIASAGKLEKALRVRATFRNATTVRKIAALLSAGK
jgi:uncharacterized protein (DUF1697 family)